MSKINSFSKEEQNRYARHFSIPEFGVTAQERLKKSSVLVVGAGGLGSPTLLYLAAAGVGHIGIVEFDIVDDSNLQRQVLYTTEDIGKSKAQTAKKRLKALNPFIEITLHETKLTTKNALEIISRYDIVADGTDNFPTRYLVNDACVLAGKVNVYASIFRFEGQVAVFNFLQKEGTRSANYRDMFPAPPPPGMVPSCAEGGVLGVLPGIIGSMQASEVIKILTSVGEPLVNLFFMMDVASFSMRTLKIKRNFKINITQLLDYELFCGISESNLKTEVKEITVSELKEIINQKADFQLIDVREDFEYELSNIGGELIPSGSILDNEQQVSRIKKVVIICRSGARSATTIEQLQALGSFDNLYNLKGGMLAWEAEK
ncbi:MAG: molybdopterin/thiamine biosynthesis adenylyltransferase/rhodanese-related sulfurtransferase [Paraglaciecola sp.]|jgi:molybdopterin/thiamine biosynthesis adenylyltransferase/rhodanese-related sulfurtransferase